MTYTIRITSKKNGAAIVTAPADTRVEAAADLDSLLTGYPRDLYGYSVTCHVGRNYTLLDGDVTTGEETLERLYAFTRDGEAKPDKRQIIRRALEVAVMEEFERVRLGRGDSFATEAEMESIKMEPLAWDRMLGRETRNIVESLLRIADE